MKTAYLRGYYWYQNFGDEILLFWLLQYLFSHYSLEKLIIEVWNKQWIDEWIQKNAEFLQPWYDNNWADIQIIQRIQTIEIKQHKWRRLSHLANLTGFWKFKKTFKFFGGGEVVSDERPFPHDGRNIPLLFNYTVRKGHFTLLGGIGTPKKIRSWLLYKYLLPRAKEIVIRDRTSFHTVVNQWYPKDKIKLHEDFSLQVLRNYQKNVAASSSDTILININSATCTHANIQKIKHFINSHPHHIKIFFPCDMDDDIHCFATLQAHIPDLEFYDRTQHTLQKTLELFVHSDAGIGSRLHFLLPLKFFNKPLQSIAHAEKVQKMLNN